MKIAYWLALGVLGYSTAAAGQIRSHKDESKEPAAAQKPANTSKAAKALMALQQASQGSDAAAYASALAAAKAAATTGQERYIIARIELNKAVAAKDYAAMRSAIDQVAATGTVEAAKLSELYSGLAGNLYSAKQYDQAASALERAMAVDPSRTGLSEDLAEIRFAQGRKAEAAALFQKEIAARTAAGQKAGEAMYKRAFEVAYSAQSPATVDLGRDWLTAYPNATSWRSALGAYLNLKKPDAESSVALFRLMDAAGAMSESADYILLASAAADEDNFVEARAVLEKGKTAGAIKAGDTNAKNLDDFLKSKPKWTTADLEEAVREPASPNTLIRVGDRYYGLGQYAKALELYRRAEGKAGVDKDQANLRIGMALARNGDKPGADAAFAKVGGRLAPVASYWRIYTKQ